MYNTRVPSDISESICKTYGILQINKNIDRENDRIIKSENALWDKTSVAKLGDLALEIIASNFQDYDISEIPERNRSRLLEILPTDLPLEFTAYQFPDGIFWERSCKSRWSTGNYVIMHDGSWKQMYMERYIQEYVENISPDDADNDQLQDILLATRQYVTSLNIRQLLPSELESGDNILNHVNLQPIIAAYNGLKKISITFGIKHCGMEFDWHLFQISELDCENIKNGLMTSHFLEILKFQRCFLGVIKLKILLSGIHNLHKLQEVDLSSCQICNEGAVIIAELIQSSNSVKSIHLTNNNIGALGAISIASSLTEHCSLDELNLRLNPIMDEGADSIFIALKNLAPLTKMCFSGCRLTETCLHTLSSALSTNTCIKELDLNANDFNENGGKLLAGAIKRNNTVTKIDLRMTNISENNKIYIMKKVALNRQNYKKREHHTA